MLCLCSDARKDTRTDRQRQTGASGQVTGKDKWTYQNQYVQEHKITQRLLFKLEVFLTVIKQPCYTHDQGHVTAEWECQEHKCLTFIMYTKIYCKS